MWLQTGEYSVEALYWLIAIAVIFVIAAVALVIAAWAMNRASTLTKALPSFGRAHDSQRPAAATPDQPRTPEALRLLDGRYANGEITREEYLQLERDLVSASARSHHDGGNASRHGGGTAAAPTQAGAGETATTRGAAGETTVARGAAGETKLTGNQTSRQTWQV